MTPTNDRQEVLYFTQPYNYTPAVVVVGADDDDVSDLQHRPRRQEDRRLQPAAPTTSSSTRTLAIDGYEFDFIIDDAEVSGYDTDTTALQDLANGRGSTR